MLRSSLLNFSILLDALDEFTSKHGGMPPLNGSIPDMTSDSENYIKLQGIYFDRAKRELREFQDLVGDRLNKVMGGGEKGGREAFLVL